MSRPVFLFHPPSGKNDLNFRRNCGYNRPGLSEKSGRYRAPKSMIPAAYIL